MPSLSWPHLLAGPLIVLDRRIAAVSADELLSRDKLTLAHVSDDLLQPKWRPWFGTTTSLSRTDLDEALAIFLHLHDRTQPRCSSLIDWYRALLGPPIDIEWRDRQPFVAPASVSRWEMLANYFDADALLTFDLANKELAHDVRPDLEALEAWQTLPAISDFELRQIFARGVSDLHVHAGGVRIAQAAWCDLMEGKEDAEVFRHLAEAYGRDYRIAATGLPENALPATPTRAIAEAKKAWAALTKALQTYSERAAPSAAGENWWTWSTARLRRERYILVRAWSRAMTPGTDQFRILRPLDRYLRHKHRFFRLVRQPVLEGIPGLRHFDENYFPLLRRHEKSWGLRRRHRFAPSPRRYMGNIGDACVYLMESGNLRRIELRIAPLPTFADYIRFFKFWSKLEQQLRPSARDIPAPQIRFAVHFKRSRDGRRRSTAQLLRDLDRDSALLRRAFAEPDLAHQHAMSALARIDVAGQERDTPIDLFVMHMRLVRGDPEMLRVLDKASQGHPCHSWLATWQVLKDHGMQRPSLAQPTLGMTAHAGEDYTDVLDRLHQIGVATDHLGMRAGDSIGHALALKASIDTSATRHLRRLQRGAHHDSLCWLHDLLEGYELTGHSVPELGVLQDMIIRSGYDIHERHHQQIAGTRADDFVWVWKHKLLPLFDTFRSAPAVRRTLVELEYREDVILRREEPIDGPRQDEFQRDRRRLDAVVVQAQAILLDRVKQKRIVIEMNPSSNLRISGVASLADSPTVGLIREARDGLLVSVNTDDPGVFASRIENEYALLLAGLRDCNIPEADARDLLDRARATGMEMLNWPRRPSLPRAPSGTDREKPRYDRPSG